MDWNGKLLDLVVGAAIGAQGALGVEHWKRRALARLSDHNPFRSISANHDLTRAVRIAWVEAALEILDAASEQGESLEWVRDSSEILRFESLARAELIAVRSAAFDRRTHPGETPIDQAVKSIIDGVPEYIGQSADTGGEADVTGGFAGTLAGLTGWPVQEVPAIFGQIASQGLAITGGGPARSFGELVFAAFAELIKSPEKYPEAREAFHIAMNDMARRLSQSILEAVGGLDVKIDSLMTNLDALDAIRNGAATYLETLNRISAGVTQISGDVSAMRALMEVTSGNNKTILNRQSKAESTAVLRHEELYSSNLRLEMKGEKLDARIQRLEAVLDAHLSIPRQGGSRSLLVKALKDVLEASQQRAEKGDERYKQALDLFTSGKVPETEPLFRQFANEKEIESQRVLRETALAFRNLAVIIAYSDPDRAIDAYKMAIKFNPDDCEAMLHIGTIQQERSLSDAEAQFRRILSFDRPENLSC